MVEKSWWKFHRKICVGARIARPRNQCQCNVFARATEGSRPYTKQFKSNNADDEGVVPYIFYFP